MQWAHLPPRKKRTSDVPALVVGEGPGLARRCRPARTARPGRGTRRAGRGWSGRSGRRSASSVAGVGSVGGRPVLSAFQPATIGASRRKTGMSRSAGGPAARACGRPPARPWSLPTAWRISTRAASGGTWFGLLVDGLLARRSRRSRSSGPSRWARASASGRIAVALANCSKRRADVSPSASSW